MHRLAFFVAFLFAGLSSTKAQWDIEASHTTADLRGIDNVGKGIAWASGANGTVLRTTDNGVRWQTCAVPPEAEHLDFRGIQAFDASTAIIMSSGRGPLSRLYKTTDACQSWTLLFTNPDPKGFWDAVSFSNVDSGWVFGDPSGGRFTLLRVLRTYKQPCIGDTSKCATELSMIDQSSPSVSADSATQTAFAASNSAFAVLWGANHVYYGPPPLDAKMAADVTHVDQEWFATGGRGGAYIFSHNINSGDYAQYGVPASWDKMAVPVGDKSESSGIFSVAFRRQSPADPFVGVAVGGDYKRPEESAHSAAYRMNWQHEWQDAQTPPHGYRSAVAYDPAAKTWITVGPNGTDISTDDGRNWRALKPSATDTPGADRDWNALSLPFVVGPHGRIGKLNAKTLAP
jgi:hypothetical protein